MSCFLALVVWCGYLLVWFDRKVRTERKCSVHQLEVIHRPATQGVLRRSMNCPGWSISGLSSTRQSPVASESLPPWPFWLKCSFCGDWLILGTESPREVGLSFCSCAIWDEACFKNVSCLGDCVLHGQVSRLSSMDVPGQVRHAELHVESHVHCMRT